MKSWDEPEYASEKVVPIRRAFDVFSERGYAGARVDDVARRAGVSKGLLYLYFKTKEELFKAVVMLESCTDSGFFTPWIGVH